MHVMDEKDDIEKSESITKNHKNDEIVINYLPPKEKPIEEINEKINPTEILIEEEEVAAVEETSTEQVEEIMETSEVSDISEIIVETSEIKESEINGKCDEKIVELIEEVKEEEIKPKLEVKVIEIPSDVPLVLSESENKENEILIEMSINEPEVTKTEETIPLEKPKEIEEMKPKPIEKIVSRKRSLSADPELIATIQPSKKLKREIDLSFSLHDKILCDYIDKTSNNNVDEMQQQIDNISEEVKTLNVMIKRKEEEWNHFIYLKKVKEEILVRLTRKKNIMEIMSTKVGQVSDNNFVDETNQAAGSTSTSTAQNTLNSQLNKKSFKDNLNASIFNNMTPPMLSSTPNNTQSNNNSTASGIIIDAVLNASSAQSILQNRANMKSADLAKEKIHTSRLQRFVKFHLDLKFLFKILRVDI